MLKSPTNDYYQHANLIFVGLLCVYVATFYLQIGKRIDFLGAIRFEFILGAALSGLSLIELARLRRPKNPLFGYLLFFYLIMLLMVVFSRDSAQSWEIFFNRVFKFSMLTLFIAAFVRSPRDLFCFIGMFLLVCFKMGQEGMVGQITGSLVWENQGINRLHGSTSMYRHPNSFSGMALGTLPFIYYLYPHFGWLIKLFLATMLAFALNIILFTGSRTGYVGFFALFGYLLMKSRYRGRAILAGTLVLIFAIPFVPEQYTERFESIFTGEEAEGDSSGKRIQILQDATEVWLRYPFGTGIYGFRDTRMEMFGRHQDTHNLYFEVLTNIGIQGFIAFFLLIYLLMKHLKRLGDTFMQHTERILAVDQQGMEEHHQHLLAEQLKALRFCAAVAYAVRAFIFMRLVIGLFGMDLYEIYWWFALGTFIALYNIEKQCNEATDQIIDEVTAGRDETNDQPIGSHS